MSDDGASGADLQPLFDFPYLVREFYVHWKVVVAALAPVTEMTQAVGQLASTLPDYIEDTADTRLLAQIQQVEVAMHALADGMQVIEHANLQIASKFIELDRAMRAAQDMNERANTPGFGRA